MPSSAGQALETRPVAHAGGHCDDRRGHQAGHHAGQRRLHAGDDHDHPGLLQSFQLVKQAVQPATPTSLSRPAQQPIISAVTAASSATGRSAVPAVTISSPASP